MSGGGSDLWDRGEVGLTIFLTQNDNLAGDLGHTDDDLELYQS